MKPTLAALLLLLLSAWLGQAQSPAGPHTSGAGARQPTKTIKIGKVSFSYYQKPEAVAAAATFYVSGSQRTSTVFDFVGLTVIFHTAGKHLSTPSFVLFNLTAATYRDGCKYRDRYADKALNHLHLAMLGDDQPVFSTDLSLSPAYVADTRNGKMCTEVYQFQLPYREFLKLSAARKAELRLGTREFKLKEDHLDALRTMRNGVGKY